MEIFFNDTRYIPLGNRQQINAESSQANKIDKLGKFKSVFLQYFEPAIDDCCLQIDLEFGLQLGKNREKLSKEQYIKLLEYLRSMKPDIKKNYCCQISNMLDYGFQKAVNKEHEQVDFSTISLISDEEVKENHVIMLIIRQCEHLFYEELISLNKYLALIQGKHTIADSQNPIFPEKLVSALVEVVKPLKLNTDSRIALYKTFEVNVFSQLGFIYRELIKRCERPIPPQLYVVGEITDCRPSQPVDSAEQPSVKFSLLQKKLGLWRESHGSAAGDLTSAAGNVFYQHFEIINALQILQQFNDESELSEKMQSLKWRVLKKMEELSFSDKVKNISQEDEDILDLVALIFSEIERDDLLQDFVKSAILQLMMPMAAVCLGRYSIFTTPENPVRQLLDDIFVAGLFLNVEEYDDRLIQQRIVSAVKKMSRDSGFEFSGWIAEAGEFSSYMNKQQQRSQDNEENTLQMLRDKQVLASSKKIVVKVIEHSMQGKILPKEIIVFLYDVWSEVLLDAYTDQVEPSERWIKVVQAMNELIVSVVPPGDDQARKQILKLLPGLIAELRKGLKQISYDKLAQSRFFKDLAVRHIILMDNKDAKKTLTEGEHSAIDSEQVRFERIVDDSSALAEQGWVAFISKSGKHWSKLVWKDADTKTMLFVGKNGMKMFEIKIDVLAKKLRLGQAAIVNSNKKTITEHVLSELMSL
ncbi:MAG: hypothetical protein RIQ94_1943 [Pseudomonadota bacterium]|jgi:hypothetical protein